MDFELEIQKDGSILIPNEEQEVLLELFEDNREQLKEFFRRTESEVVFGEKGLCG
jgi:hypothetical protein